ncbi:hypothetical protein Nepgr_029910 [Nepenthes gracilis]|uniref:3'-5' exonuclease domain-containing protein n=1 Tax=Nepenthes gracilis TaxID=150966 RepID=A0AAD3TG73_NEPGR|nr:hypothetical protein Nepgr_029910 [Nepenthes gracilis]
MRNPWKRSPLGKPNEKKGIRVKALFFGINIARQDNSSFISLQLRPKTTERMIPLSILLKTGQYDIQISDKPVKVVVRDSVVTVNSCVDNDLTPKLRNQPPVVGLDLHSRKNRLGGPSTNSLLVLCIDDYCLVVQLKYVGKIPGYLKRFLGDENICFVGVDVDRKLSRGIPSSPDPLVCNTAVELSHLAARIRKKPSLLNGDIEALAKEVEVHCETAASGGFCAPQVNHEARVFPEDEVKALVYDAYLCYQIGKSLVKELPPARKLPREEKKK